MSVVDLTGETVNSIKVVFDPTLGGDHRYLLCRCEKCGSDLNLIPSQLEEGCTCQRTSEKPEVKPKTVKKEPKVKEVKPMALFQEFMVGLPMAGRIWYKVNAPSKEIASGLLKQRMDGKNPKQVTMYSQQVFCSWSGDQSELVFKEVKSVQPQSQES